MGMVAMGVLAIDLALISTKHLLNHVLMIANSEITKTATRLQKHFQMSGEREESESDRKQRSERDQAKERMNQRVTL